MLNRGVFQLPGDKGQWMLSVARAAEDAKRDVEAFGASCAELAR